ncbi:MAG: hypothetical protein JRM80_06405 [Nitrososphaerota archaeon]|nr:hypothetical protein [Nitrososphaerota archaeon]
MVGAFALPTLASLAIVWAASRIASLRHIAAFALGVYLWFFVDTLGDSAYLGVNSGLGGGAGQGALIVLFIAGALVLSSIDGGPNRHHAGAGLWFGVPLLVALGVGIHGFGEGAAFSSVAASTPAQDLVSAFGGLSPAVSFVTHKLIEPVIVGAVYLAYASEHAKSSSDTVRDLAILALVFVLPGLIGAAAGYSLTFDSTYVFAFGLGASTYAATKVIGALSGSSDQSRWASAKTAFAIVLGFLSLYSAALFH